MSPAATGAPGKRPTSKEAIAAKVKRERRCLTKFLPWIPRPRDPSPALAYARIRRSVHTWNVPDPIHRTLKSRAAQAGMMLTDYLLGRNPPSAERDLIIFDASAAAELHR